MSHPQADAVLTGDGADAHSITAGISLQEMRPRVLKGDDTFAVLNRNGDALPAPGGPEGLYHRDTRHLSRLELSIAGRKRRRADKNGAWRCRPGQPGPHCRDVIGPASTLVCSCASTVSAAAHTSHSRHL